MNLVTYNIRFGLGTDQKIDLERIADTVKNADIIALQEVERNWQRSGMTDQPDIISKHLQNYYWVFFPAFDVDASKANVDGSVVNRRRQFGSMVLSRWPIRMARYILFPKFRTTDWFKGLLPLLPVTPDVDRPSTFPARFLDRAGRCAGAFGLGEVGFECCQAGWRAGTRP